MRNNGTIGLQYYDFSNLKLKACGQDTTMAGAPMPATGRWHRYEVEVVMNNNASRTGIVRLYANGALGHRGYERGVGALWQKPGALWVPTLKPAMRILPNRVDTSWWWFKDFVVYTND